MQHAKAMTQQATNTLQQWMDGEKPPKTKHEREAWLLALRSIRYHRRRPFIRQPETTWEEEERLMDQARFRLVSESTHWLLVVHLLVASYPIRRERQRATRRRYVLRWHKWQERAARVNGERQPLSRVWS